MLPVWGSMASAVQPGSDLLEPYATVLRCEWSTRAAVLVVGRAAKKKAEKSSKERSRARDARQQASGGSVAQHFSSESGRSPRRRSEDPAVGPGLVHSCLRVKGARRYHAAGKEVARPPLGRVSISMGGGSLSGAVSNDRVQPQPTATISREQRSAPRRGEAWGAAARKKTLYGFVVSSGGFANTVFSP